MNEQVFYGLDVSKGYADINRKGCSTVVDKTTKKVISDWKFNDTKEGIKQLQLLVKKDLDNGFQIVMGVESTGGYENNWYNNLINFHPNLKMIRINPIRIHHESKKDMKRNITDKVSGQMIARHLEENHEKLIHLPAKTKKQSNLCRLLTLHQMLIKQRTQLFNQLEKCLYDTMPGLLSISKDYPQYLLNLLKKVPCKAKLIKINPASLAKIKGISYDKAVQIIKAVKEDSGLNDDPVMEYQIQTLVNEINLKNQSISEIEDKIKSDDEIKIGINILSSIPGCGENSAAMLCIEIGDIKKFSSAAQMCSYFGVHPQIKQSGDALGKAVMSKKGSSKYRSIIYMVAKNAVLYSAYFKEIYALHRSKGKSHNSALGAIMNKLTRIIYGMLATTKSFNEDNLKQKELFKPISVTIQIQEIELEINKMDLELKNIYTAPVSSIKLYRMKKAMKESQNSLKELKTRSSSPPVTKV